MSDSKIIKILDEMCEVVRALVSQDEKGKKVHIRILEIQKSLIQLRLESEKTIPVQQKQKRKSGPTGKVLQKYNDVFAVIKAHGGITVPDIIEKMPNLHPRTVRRIIFMLIQSFAIKRQKIRNSGVFAYWPMTK